MRAIIIGATGLVGSAILKETLANEKFTQVHVFARRSTKIIHAKLKEHIIDFENVESVQSLIFGDVLFSALGTTLKVAGSKVEQYKVDFHHQYDFAKIARANGVKNLVLISSTGAHPSSRIFYLKMKGELEEKITDLKFESFQILRPGPLKGKREKERMSEIISTFILGFLPRSRAFGNMLPVDAAVVASKSVQVALNKRLGKNIFEASDILF